MHQLRTCDFCGDDAAGTFEIVPPELNPTEAEQRRIVLCTDCKPTLEELVQPLLARASAESTAETDAAQPVENPAQPAEDAAQPAHATRTATGAERQGTDAEGGRASTEYTDEADGGDDEATVDETGSGGHEPETTENSGTPGIDRDRDAAEPVVTPDRPDRSTGTSEGVAIQPDGASRERDDRESAATGTDTDDSSPTDVASATAARTGEATSGSAPRAYGKVLRLLQNRELPMARADVEALAAGAYDLEDHQVEAVVDYAIEQGDLVEDGRNVRLG
ncbi:hypothetical protein [Halovivax cerinus]|uniref:Uncharacterized protein n=1 Tax=Halovivax cerinus TaxID=1487865 RepID=A0ABD5NRK6_9EURY|nr:hypothetical protein [Halovivax cerinus]